MSRSYRHKPIFSRTCAGDRFSDKEDKRRAWRKLRTALRSHRHKWWLTLRAVSTVCTFRKEGKHWWGEATRKDMSK